MVISNLTPIPAQVVASSGYHPVFNRLLRNITSKEVLTSPNSISMCDSCGGVAPRLYVIRWAHGEDLFEAVLCKVNVLPDRGNFQIFPHESISGSSVQEIKFNIQNNNWYYEPVLLQQNFTILLRNLLSNFSHEVGVVNLNHIEYFIYEINDPVILQSSLTELNLSDKLIIDGHHRCYANYLISKEISEKVAFDTLIFDKDINSLGHRGMSKYIDSEYNDYIFDFIQQEWDSRTSSIKNESLFQLFKIATVTYRGYSFDLKYKDCLNGLILLNEIMVEAESKFSGQFNSSYLLQLNSCIDDNSLIINLTSPSSEELMIFSSNGILLPRKFTEFFPKDILMLFHE